MATLANLNPDDENNQQPTTGGQPPQVAVAPAIAVSAPNSAAPAQTNQGSGRFTNINKYLGANKAAGQQIAQRVGTGINEQLNTSAKGAETNVDAFRQGVEKAEQSNTVGQGLVGQVTAGNVGQIAQAPDALKQYVTYKSGLEATNQQKAVGQAQSAADLSAQKAQNEITQRQQQLGTEQNRVGLLTEFVGSPGGGYSKGAQRLDQAFLQRDKSNALGNLNTNLKTQEQGRFKAFADDNKKFQDQAKTTLDASGKLVGNLNTATQDQYKASNKDIDDTNAAIVTQRKKDTDYATAQINALLDDSQDTVVDANWLKERGVNQGQRTFGALTNLSADQIAQIGNAAANTSQTSSAEQVSKYNALQKLMNSNLVNNELQYDPSKEMTKAELAAAVNYRSGNEGLAAEVDKARSRFEQAVGSTGPIMGQGNWGGAGAQESQSIADYLAAQNQGILRGNTSNSASFGSGIRMPGSSGGGISQENYTQAEAIAAQDRINLINDWLRNQSYDETITAGGRTRGDLNADTSYQNLANKNYGVK